MWLKLQTEIIKGGRFQSLWGLNTLERMYNIRTGDEDRWSCVLCLIDNTTVLDNMIWGITGKQLHSAARLMHENKHIKMQMRSIRIRGVIKVFWNMKHWHRQIHLYFGHNLWPSGCKRKHGVEDGQWQCFPHSSSRQWILFL